MMTHLADESIKRGNNEGGSKNQKEIAAGEIIRLVTPELVRQWLACFENLKTQLRRCRMFTYQRAPHQAAQPPGTFRTLEPRHLSLG